VQYDLSLLLHSLLLLSDMNFFLEQKSFLDDERFFGSSTLKCEKRVLWHKWVWQNRNVGYDTKTYGDILPQ